jgi:hypothetical protein
MEDEKKEMEKEERKEKHNNKESRKRRWIGCAGGDGIGN